MVEVYAALEDPEFEGLIGTIDGREAKPKIDAGKIILAGMLDEYPDAKTDEEWLSHFHGFRLWCEVAKQRTLLERLIDAVRREFSEDLHPRDERGRFASGGGGGGGGDSGGSGSGPSKPNPQGKQLSTKATRKMTGFAAEAHRHAQRIEQRVSKLNQSYHVLDMEYADRKNESEDIWTAIEARGDNTPTGEEQDKLSRIAERKDEIVQEQLGIYRKIRELEGGVREAVHKDFEAEGAKQYAVKVEGASDRVTAGMMEKANEAGDFISRFIEPGLMEQIKEVRGNETTARVDYLRGRANYNYGTINMDPTDDTGVYVHELGHHLEDLIPSAHYDARKWRDSHTEGEETRPLRDIDPQHRNFDRNEVGRADKFYDVYVGKEYKTGDTEVVSMGIEAFYRDPVEFARKDPEHFNFIIGLLQPNRESKGRRYG